MSVKALTWAWEQDLSAPAKLVLLALADHANEDGDGWPSLSSVARKCRMTRRTVRKHIHDIIDLGLMEKEGRFRDNGSQSSNTYHLCLGDIEYHTLGEVSSDLGGRSIPTEGVGQYRPRGEVENDLGGRSLVTYLEPPYEPPYEPPLEIGGAPLPEWLEVLDKVQPLLPGDAERLTKWAGPYGDKQLRETAYIVVQKWPHYSKKNKDIYATFQNWVRRDNNKPPPLQVDASPKIDYSIEAHIHRLGLHPASAEAAKIRLTLEKRGGK